MTEPDDDLEELFAAARRHAPRPDGALLGRIAADAARLAPGRGWRGLWRAVGGWPALAGFAAAAAVGVWIGAAAPAPVDAVIGGAGYDLSDLMPGYGADWEDAG